MSNLYRDAAMPKATDSPPSAEPLRKVGNAHAHLREKVVDELRRGILNGRFEPGERLVEERLAEELGVSRNPIREAIRTLTSEGLVEVSPRRGALVVSLSREEGEELLEVRAALEGANARLAARRGDKQILERLREILTQGSAAVEGNDLSELAGLNDAFHAELARAGHNRMLADLIRSLRDRSAPLFRGTGTAASRRSWSEHEGILRAVIAGDAELASLLAHRHVLNAGRRGASVDAALATAAE